MTSVPETLRVAMWAEHPANQRWAFPDCGKELVLYSHAEERTWRHLDSCQYQTYLQARISRVNCPAHAVNQVQVPWAEPKSRFKLLFERLAIDNLGEWGMSRAAQIFGISWDEGWGMMKRALERGRAPKAKKGVRRIGVDEKVVAKGHKYMTLVCDLDEETVEHVAEGKIVFDRFHIRGSLGKAVDAVRKQEHGDLLEAGDETLKGSKYLWLCSRENVPRSRRLEFTELKRGGLKVSRAWAIKELLRDLWRHVNPKPARKFWKRSYFWATHSRLNPIIEAAETVKRHIANIMTYLNYRITNALSESLNRKIQPIKQRACGFRNIEHFKTAISFHCGGLDLSPC